MSLFNEEIENRIVHFVELQDDNIFEDWTPSQKVYNKIDCILASASDVESGAIDILCDLKDFFDNSKGVEK